MIELNPGNLFGSNLSNYIEVDELKHQENLEQFEELCIYILNEIKSFKGFNSEFKNTTFRLAKPFSEILVSLSYEDYYIRFDFQKEGNRISYFNKEKYDDFLNENNRWILQVLLDNKDELLEVLLYRVRREISFANNETLNDEFRKYSLLFNNKNFNSIIRDFLPKLGNVLFLPNNNPPIRFNKSFIIINKFFSPQQLRFKINKDVIEPYKFDIYYDSFLLTGNIEKHPSGCYYNFYIYDVYHTTDNKVLLYSYESHNNKVFINTSEGPQKYRLNAFFPLVEIYEILNKRIKFI